MALLRLSIRMYQLNIVQGDSPTVITVEFQTKMQAIIDKYKAEQIIFTNILVNQQMTWLNSHLTG